jgi:hypothetical protein
MDSVQEIVVPDLPISIRAWFLGGIHHQRLHSLAMGSTHADTFHWTTFYMNFPQTCNDLYVKYDYHITSTLPESKKLTTPRTKEEHHEAVTIHLCVCGLPENECQKNTMKNYEFVLRKFQRHFGDIKLDEQFSFIAVPYQV